MINEFKKGNYYRYIGYKRESGWNHAGQMDFVLDGKWRRCIEAFGEDARFEDMSGMRWWWGDGIENWEEWQPKRGDKIQVSDDLDNWHDVIFVTYVEGAWYPVITANKNSGFEIDQPFTAVGWKHMRPVETEDDTVDKLKELFQSIKKYDLQIKDIERVLSQMKGGNHASGN